MPTTAAPDLERELVGVLREQKRVIALAEITRLRTVVEGSLPHQAPADVDPDDVGFGARYLALAGPGAPVVDEFAVLDLAATLGMSDHAGRDFVGHALELRYRLPRLWARVMAGRVPTWRATRIAAQTSSLPAEAATHVDEQLSHVVGGLGTPAVDRLVAETKIRFDPIAAAKQTDGRYFQLGHTERDYEPDSIHGQVRVHGLLDAADALDLEKKVSRVATQLADLGATESLDVRRSMAVGEIARAQLALDLGSDSGGRSVELVVHVSPASPVARLENTRDPVILDAVRAWCETAAEVVIRPVIDLNQAVHVTQYEVPDRLRRQVVWRDQTCVFPHCHRAASRCDVDHVVPFGAGGAPSTDNLAPLCRRHHRAKTHGRFRYRVVAPGAYEWTLPSGWRIRRDHEGTHPPLPPDE